MSENSAVRVTHLSSLAAAVEVVTENCRLRGRGESPKLGVGKLTVSGLLQVELFDDTADENAAGYCEVKVLAMFATSGVDKHSSGLESKGVSSMRNSMTACRIRSELFFRFGNLARRASKSSSESFGGKKAKGAVGSKGWPGGMSR